MKLQTKFQNEDFELGEVVDADIATMPDGRIKLQALAKKGGFHTIFYDSLEKIYSEWQDYEEPKGVQNVYVVKDWVYIKMSSEEEAEKAVEKLKAWTRLENKGFRFDEYDATNRAGDNAICGQVYFKGGNYDIEEIRKDLDLLFGGEDA